MSMSLAAPLRRALSALLVLVALPQAALATLDDVGHAPPSKHRIRFVLHPDVVTGLTPTETGRRLGQYVADMNTVFLRETVRSFVFDPATDVRLLSGSETCQFDGTFVAGEIKICVEKSNIGYSYGGGGTRRVNPIAGFIYRIGWQALYDPLQLSTQVVPPALMSSQEDYLKRQLDVVIHEMEHVFSAGSGEYYNLASVADRTGVEPILNLSYTNETDRFWYEHIHWEKEPLFKAPTYRQRADFLSDIRFAAGTKAVINTDWSDLYWAYHYFDNSSATVVRVTDPVTKAPVVGATVMAWSPTEPTPFLQGQGTTDANGRFVFDWRCRPCYQDKVLVKAWANGRVAAAKWFTGYDAMEQKGVQGQTEFVIDLALPTPDTQPPTVSVSAPTKPVVDVPVIVKVRNVADNTGIWGVRVHDGRDTICTVKVDSNCLWTPKSAGSVNLRAVAMDLAGNSTVATTQALAVNPADVQAPLISLTPPSQAKLGVTVKVPVQASDNVGVTRLETWENGRFMGTIAGAPSTINFTPSTLGYVNLEVRAIDQAGNRGSASFGVVVQ